MTTPSARDSGSGREPAESAADHQGHVAASSGDDGAAAGSSSPTVHIREVRQGRKPGERYVRVHRPSHDSFREAIRARSDDQRVHVVQLAGFRPLAPGRYEVRAEATAPKSSVPRAWARLKRLLIGEPIATAEAGHERLTKAKALAVFASDALSSCAYATEEILLVLLLAGSAALWVSLPIAGVVALLLAIVGFSYSQTIKAYPNGGGSYIVAKDNLGTLPGLTAGASLLVSYVLTVSVSVAAAVLALTSVHPELSPWRVPLGIGAIALITLVNLRGIRESATIFMLPTYVFLVCMAAMVGYGLYQFGFQAPAPPREQVAGTSALTAFLVLRAFASGGAALTGTEAIADGVPAFKPVEWKNARTTLIWMVAILGALFSSVTYLAYQIGIVPHHGGETVVSQIGRAVFGSGPLHQAVQYSTMMVLVLAANTAYADFPRLGFFLARDKFLPSQFSFRGDRLAYSTGIMALGVLSVAVLWFFGGDISSLIPLYAFGVFSAFTFSQSAMVSRWWRLRERGWQFSLICNTFGAIATFTVLLIVATTKFLDGAWIAIVLLPLLVFMMLAIHRHYTQAAAELTPETPMDQGSIKHNIIVPIGSLNQIALQTLAYAQSIARDPDDQVTAVHVADDLEATEELQRHWEEWHCGVPLIIIESPYRSLVSPLLAYIEAVQKEQPDTTISVIMPEYVPGRWWEHVLHNQTALRVKAALLFRPGVVVVSVPYHLRRATDGAKPSTQSPRDRAQEKVGAARH